MANTMDDPTTVNGIVNQANIERFDRLARALPDAREVRYDIYQFIPPWTETFDLSGSWLTFRDRCEDSEMWRCILRGVRASRLYEILETLDGHWHAPHQHVESPARRSTIGYRTHRPLADH